MSASPTITVNYLWDMTLETRIHVQDSDNNAGFSSEPLRVSCIYCMTVLNFPTNYNTVITYTYAS
jgi:hypothetical protein